MAHLISCSRCNKGINHLKTRTRIVWGTYKAVQLTQLTQGLLGIGDSKLCETCNKELKKWMDEKINE